MIWDIFKVRDKLLFINILRFFPMYVYMVEEMKLQLGGFVCIRDLYDCI